MNGKTAYQAVLAAAFCAASAITATAAAAERLASQPEEVREIALADILEASAGATAEAFPDADTVVLDSVSCEAYEEDGTSILFDDTYTKVLTEKGRRSESASSLGFNAFYSDLKVVAAEIVKPDGTVVKVDLDRNCSTSIDPGMMSANIYDPDDKVTTVSYPNLEIGDIVRLAIVREEKKARVPGVWSDYQTFELFDPILRYTYAISAPAGLPVRSIALRDEIPGTIAELAPIATDGGARILRQWDIANVPQAFAEPSMPPLHTVCQRLLLSTASSWQELSRWYWNLCKPHLDATTDEMRDTVKELVADSPGEDESIWRIFTWVSQNVRYMGITTETEAPGYEPHDASVTFGRRHGVCRDKAALLASMLRLAGIDAYPVLIHVGEKRDPDVPMTFFNHAIVGVRGADGAFTLMDPTNENSADLLPAYLAGKSYLAATPEGEPLQTSPEIPASANMLFAETKAKVDLHGKITASSKFRFTGLNDSAYRGMLVRRPAEQRREFLEQVAKRAIPGATLDAFAIEPEDLRDTETPLSIRIDVSAPDFLVRGDGATLVDIPRFSSFVGYHNFILGAIGLETRRFPLETEDACGAEESFEIDFAALADAVALPDNVSFSTNGVTYSQGVFDTIDPQSGHHVLKATSRTEFNLTSYPPELYRPFKETFHGISNLAGQPAVFGPAPSPQEATADSRILSLLTEFDVDSPTSWTKTVTSRREVLTYAGRRSCSELKIPYNPAWQQVEILEASVSNANGRVQLATDDEINVMDASWAASAPRYPSGKTMVVSLPGVEIGSVVLLSYRITQTNAPFFSHTHVFSGKTPRDEDVLVMRFSGDAAARLADLNESGAEAIRTGGRDQLEYAEKEMPDGSIQIAIGARHPRTLPLEGSLPDISHFADYATISLGDWDDYAASLRRAIADATSPSNTTRCAALAMELCEGLGHVEDKITAIRDFAARNIRRAGPSFTDLPLTATPADVTLTDGYGNSLDRAILISALLFDAGIDNAIVFAADEQLEERIGGEISRLLALPDPDTFTHPLVEINLTDDDDDYPIYLNDTDQYATLGMTYHYGCHALTTIPDDPDIGLFGDDAAESGAAFQGPVKPIYMEPAFDPSSLDSMKIVLEASGDATVEVAHVVDGTGADALLKRYAEMTPELLSRHHQELCGAIDISARPVGELAVSTNSLPYSIRYSAEVPGFATRTGNVLTLAVSAESVPAMREKDRELPFWLPQSPRSANIVQVVLPPELKRILSRPQDFDYNYTDVGFGEVSRASQIEDDGEGHKVFSQLTLTSNRDAAAFGPEFNKTLLELERRLNHPASRLLVIEVGE